MPSNHPLVRTGVAGLDDILCGGLPAERLYLVEGDPGSGKTTLGLQYLLEGRAKGENGIYVTLSETRDELVAVADSHGWTLDQIGITELSPPEEALTPDEENTLFYPSELELSETTKLVLNEVDRVKPRRVVFDSLSEMRLLAQNSLRYRRQILALKQFFTGRQCTVLLLDDRTSDAADLQLQSIAHGVISLERKSPEYGITQRRLQIMKMRGRDFRAGFHDYVIRPGGMTVFPRLVASEHFHEYAATQVQSGVKELDQLMHGGLDRGTSTLVTGPSGTGKSTIAVQFAHEAARRGERSALFLFDESERMLLHRAAGMGMDVARFREDGTMMLRQIDPGSVSIGELVAHVREQVERGVKLLVIDSLNGYLNAMPEARFLPIQLHELLTYLGQCGVTTILVSTPHGLPGTQMVSPVDASYIADSVILLRYFEAMGDVRLAMSVVKKRGGVHEKTIREYSFDGNGIHVGAPLTEFQGVLTGTPTFTGVAASLQAPQR